MSSTARSPSGRWLCTYAAAGALLLALAISASSADAQQRLPNCDRQQACSCEPLPANSFRLYCDEELNYTFRAQYTAPRADAAASVVVWCDPTTMQRAHYQRLFSYNMSLGAVESVVMHLCPLPNGRLEEFFSRLGITDVQLFKLTSHSLFNDTMPADFLHGTNLTNLWFNKLAHVQLDGDSFRTSPLLANLSVTGCSLSPLPADLFRRTPRMFRLGLTDNQLHTLPDELFDGLSELRQLSLGNNRLTNLTRRHFRDLARLTQLDMYKNGIRTLPEDVFEPLRSLQTLRINFNPLQALPERLFAGTPALRLLKLNSINSNAALSDLPAGLFRGLRQLELLMLDKLNIRRLSTGLFADLTALTNLTLDHNQLTSLPEGSFSGLDRLLNLDLSWNRLTAVSPDLLAGLHNLDTLYLNHNGLRALPDDMFTATPRLERLFLHYNNMSAVRQRTFSGLSGSLRLLRLDHNHIALNDSVLVSPAFQELMHLQELYLAYNRIGFLTRDLTTNLMRLRRLDLRFNQLQKLDYDDLNFLAWDALIDLRFNHISRIEFALAPLMVDGNGDRVPNTFLVEENPLNCDCSLVSLKAYMDQTGQFADRQKLDELFLLRADQLQCAGPPPVADYLFAQLTANQLLCPLHRDCPAGCQCQHQPSTHTVQVTCERLPSGAALPTTLPRVAADSTVHVHLEWAGLQRLTNLSVTSVPVSGLFLSHNNLTQVPVRHLPPTLRTLRLDHNLLRTVPAQLVAYLNRTGVTVSLGHNPLLCDCTLLPLYQFVQLDVSNGSRQLQDAGDMFCAAQNRSLLELLPEELCPGVAGAVIAVCVAVTALGMLLLVTAVIYYNMGETLRVWLYARGWCLWWVSEEELDADKQFDAFVSYSHLDEAFVVEQLVPQLERGEPRFRLCLHFRDWLAGEWIADQIQSSVQNSRRVIVVMSENFLRSEWGRLEFIAAHKQALNDKRNRLIIIVYGELPAPELLEPEVRMYLSMNTYLRWGDALFWERLRYALPHKGRRPKRRRRLTTDKLGLIIREPSSAGSTPTATPPADAGVTVSCVSNGHLNQCFVPDKLAPIGESRLREQLADNLL